ncbi:MAG: phosphoribosyltransferase [Halodesulfurarchaeum sp.]
MFRDREAAGEQLAEVLQHSGVEIDLVLAIPRGGLPVGRAVADAYDVPLDIVAAKKLGAPGNPEFGIGAATADGSVWLNDDLIDSIGVGQDYLEREREQAVRTAKEKAETYREGRDAPSIQEKHVAIVDDGVATGATMFACLRAVRAADASRVVVAVPVGPPDSLSNLEVEADEVVAVERPSAFSAVGAFYADFGQVSDEEARAYLRN